MFGAVDDVVVTVADRGALHPPNVRPGIGLAHRQTVVAVALDCGDQVALFLFLRAGHEDVRRAGHDVVHGVASRPELAFDQGHGE